MISKRVNDSLIEQVNIVMPQHTNSQQRLFGGQLLAWIDIVASVVSRRHSNRLTSTVSIDELSFMAPAMVGDVVVLIGRVTYVGRTSMEVRVDSYVDHISGERTLINEAYLVMVAMDENERPVSVPGLICDTVEEKLNWQAGQKRYLERQGKRLSK